MTAAPHTVVDGTAAAVHLDLHTREVGLRAETPRDPALRLRLTSADDARRELAEVHRAAAAQRVGSGR